MHIISIVKNRSQTLIFTICLVYVILSFLALENYFLWDATMLAGLFLAPYIITIETGKFSLRYLVPAVIITVVALIIPVKTVIFLALLVSLLLFIENSCGKVNLIAIVLILLISPLFKYFSNAFGFSIRLWLTEVASSILGLFGAKAVASGNLIAMGEHEYSVDQACAGLNMLAISLILCLFTVAYYQKRLDRRLKSQHLILLFFTTIGLNIAANLARILLLVIFNIGPENMYHDIIGILCLITYVIIPLLFISRLLIQRCGAINERKTNSISKLRYPALHCLFLGTISFASLNAMSMDEISKPIGDIKLEGYKKTVLKNRILKFESNKALVYLKPTTFYAPEHDPMVCWRGSGYHFKSIKKEVISGTEIYTGILVKGKDKIYSSWWFDDGKSQTINQLSWRWKAAKGEGNFYLVNANAEDPATLKQIIQKLLKQANFHANIQ